MSTLCLILARAGSKGLPGKNIAAVAGRPMVAWAVAHAQAAQLRGVIDRIALSTDGEAIAAVGREMGVAVTDRPAELAGDTATIADAARHAVEQFEKRHSKINRLVILYGNVPARPDDLIDRALAKLTETGCDSVQSVCPVGKMHPYWMKTLSGENGDVLEPFIENTVDRRQDLPPVYMLDGGIIAVTRAALMQVDPANPHAFLGSDRRAIVTRPGDVVDVDEPVDLQIAEAQLRQQDSGPPVVIGDRAIDPDQPVYIIAELGVNHDGSVERALELTRAAHAAGADAVKLQLFDPDLLLSAEAELAGYQESAASDPHAMLRALQLDRDEMARVGELAHELGLGFIVTPFSLENFDDMRRLDPDAVKIASPDCVNGPLIARMAELGKPMIVSTGASRRDEWSAELTGRWGKQPTVVMHCVSAYPVPLEQADLGALAALVADCRIPIGYSDHTASPWTGALAVLSGATVLEKHVTHDHSAAGPDHAASLDPPQFTEYVQRARQAQTARSGGARDEVKPIERDVRRVARQSVCAVRDLQAGQVIGPGDVTVKRPGTGISAGQLHEVIGKTLQRDVKANHLLHDGDVEV